MNPYINLGQPFNDFVKKNEKLGRFNFKILPIKKKKSPSPIKKKKSPVKIGRFLIRHVKSPSKQRQTSPKRRQLSSPKMTSLKRELSDPEYCIQKVVVRGFNFTIVEEPEKMEEKIKYLTEKIKENLMQTLEINKMIMEREEYKDVLLEEKNKLKNNINKYNHQLNEIMDNIF